MKCYKNFYSSDSQPVCHGSFSGVPWDFKKLQHTYFFSLKSDKRPLECRVKKDRASSVPQTFQDFSIVPQIKKGWGSLFYSFAFVIPQFCVAFNNYFNPFWSWFHQLIKFEINFPIQISMNRIKQKYSKQIKFFVLTFYYMSSKLYNLFNSQNSLSIHLKFSWKL